MSVLSSIPNIVSPGTYSHIEEDYDGTEVDLLWHAASFDQFILTQVIVLTLKKGGVASLSCDDGQVLHHLLPLPTLI